MKTSTLQFLALVALTFPALGGIPSGWTSDYRECLAAAKTNHQPVLMSFTASWCGPCQRMARTTFSDQAVTRALESVPHVALDIDEQPILAEQHGIRAVPTFQVVAPAGTPVASLTGFQEPASFLEWLTNSLNAAKAALARQEQRAQQFAAAESLLARPDGTSRSNAVAGLLELCAEQGEGMRDKVTARLTSLPAEDVPWMIEGLNHPALAVRIHAANLLRARVGDAFDIDPWSGAEERRKAVTVWRAKVPSLNLK